MREVKHNGGTLKVMEKGETLNPNGRPKKGISLFIQQCKDNGVEQASKNNIEATYLSLINMTGEELKKAGLDEKQPIIVRKLAEFIAKSKDIDIFEKILDRGIGKSMPKDSTGEDKKFETLILTM